MHLALKVKFEHLLGKKEACEGQGTAYITKNNALFKY